MTRPARLLSLPKLRECLIDARAFASVSGDHQPAHHVALAIAAAEKHEPPDSFKTCPEPCGNRHQRNGRYCCFECAEEDGAVEK